MSSLSSSAPGRSAMGSAHRHVRRHLADLGLRPRRSLGQHFLADATVTRRIIELARVEPADVVVEVGPGLGALTEVLAETAADLRLVEYDPALAAALRQRFAGQSHVRVVEGDILQVDLCSLTEGKRPAVVVANLPYNVATAVIARMLDHRPLFARMVVMVQREVAERLRAAPGSKAYGVLSVLTQMVARVERGFRVPAGAFVPRPAVESEVVLIQPSIEPRARVEDFESFRSLVRCVFARRRKQLVNSLRPLCEQPAELLRAIDIDPRRRPETLSLEELATLSNALHDRG